MDKKKIRKSLSKAHKAIKPLTDKLSHKDMKHVNDGMQEIMIALNKANSDASNKFLAKEKVSKSGQKWSIEQLGAKQPLTTRKTMNVLEDAKKFIKENY